MDASISDGKGQVSIPKGELEKAQTKLNGVVRDVADLQDFFSKYNGGSELQSPHFPSSSISASSPQKEQPEPFQADSPSEKPRKLKYESNYEKRMDLTEYNESTDEYHHIGGGSSAALAQALGKLPKDRGDRRRFQEIFGKNMPSRFGLETTNVTYPFTELWDDRRGLKKLKSFQKILPSRSECLGYALPQMLETVFLIHLFEERALLAIGAIHTLPILWLISFEIFPSPQR